MEVAGLAVKLSLLPHAFGRGRVLFWARLLAARLSFRRDKPAGDVEQSLANATVIASPP